MTQRAWRYLEELCRLPHRASASEAEAAAADRIASWLSALGYAVEVQPFRAPRDTLYAGPVIVLGGLLAAAFWGLIWQPWIGLVGCALVISPLVGEMLGARCDMDLLLPLFPSRNVVARPQQIPDPHRPTVVISAHYDTQRASWLFHPAFARLLQGYFYVVYISLVLVPAGLLLCWAWPGGRGGPAVLGAGVVLSAIHMLFLLLCRWTGRHTNGANDNGSGVAVALALAERWAAAGAGLGANPVFLFTGSEEVGTRGIKHFLRCTPSLDPDRTRFINIDNVGGGTLHYLTGEGMLRRQPYGTKLLAAAAALAREHPGRLLPRDNLLLPTDGFLPALHGFETISFLAFQPDGTLPNYHWHTDRLDRIDRDLLDFAEGFLWEYLCRVTHAAVESR